MKIKTLGTCCVPLIISFGIYFTIPEVQAFIAEGILLLKAADLQGLRVFILSYGILAPIMSILLMVLQSLVPLVPGVIMTITNAWLFGWFYGCIYSGIGALLGAILDFTLARCYGRLICDYFFELDKYKELHLMIRKNGIFAIFLSRLVPIVPFKVISYSAGFVKLPFKYFLFATAVGQMPAIFLYSWLGEKILSEIHYTIIITLGLLILSLIIYHYRNVFQRYSIKL